MQAEVQIKGNIRPTGCVGEKTEAPVSVGTGLLKELLGIGCGKLGCVVSGCNHRSQSWTAQFESRL